MQLKAVSLLVAGYFSLNVPSGLTLYWFTNNLLTTGQQVRILSDILFSLTQLRHCEKVVALGSSQMYQLLH